MPGTTVPPYKQSSLNVVAKLADIHPSVMPPPERIKSGLQTDVAVIIVTARNADNKLLNRLMCHLEVLCGYDQEWRIPRTKDISSWVDEPDVFPLTEFKDNEWEGATIAEIERIANSNDDGHLSCFLILDDKGVRDETVILSDGWLSQTDLNSPNQIRDRREVWPGYTQYEDAASRFNEDERCKVRMPWTEVPENFYATFNMHSCFADMIQYPCDECWEELCQEEEGGRWYLDCTVGYPPRVVDPEFDPRGDCLEQEIEELRKAGLA